MGWRHAVMRRPIPWRLLRAMPGRLIPVECVHAAQELVAYWGLR